MVEAFMDSLNVAVTLVPTETPVAPLAGEMETTAGTVPAGAVVNVQV
jgi:hypothetical protein